MLKLVNLTDRTEFSFSDMFENIPKGESEKNIIDGYDVSGNAGYELQMHNGICYVMTKEQKANAITEITNESDNIINVTLVNGLHKWDENIYAYNKLECIATNIFVRRCNENYGLHEPDFPYLWELCDGKLTIRDKVKINIDLVDKKAKIVNNNGYHIAGDFKSGDKLHIAYGPYNNVISVSTVESLYKNPVYEYFSTIIE